jgi:ribosomal protein L32E
MIRNRKAKDNYFRTANHKAKTVWRKLKGRGLKIRRELETESDVVEGSLEVD